MRGSASAERELAAAAGLELPWFRDEHVAARIDRALERERVADAAALARLFRQDDDARRRFRRSVAVSVSGLFRDAGQFELLEHELLPPLLAGGRRLSVWSAGCADGSELFSVAVLLERLGVLERSFLLGNDLLEENIATAREGRYGDVPMPERLRAAVRWERRDIVLEGAPSTNWRLVLCRNVAIYLAPAARRRLHETLADALALGGVLLLGRSERLADPRVLGLEPAGPHAYRKVV